MRTIKIITSLALLSLLLFASAFVLYAQGSDNEREEGEVRPQDEIGELGLADPPPSGFSVLYMFTGASNDTTTPDTIATSVHCTNFGPANAQVQVQFFSPSAGNTYSATLTIISNQTRTFSTQPTVIYFEDSNVNAGFLDQGSGRVLANKSHLICTAQVLDPTNNQPLFMTKLPLFDKNGNLASSIRKLYLPVIVKGAAL